MTTTVSELIKKKNDINSYDNILNKDFKTINCKLIVQYIQNILEKKNYDLCKNIPEYEKIGEGNYGIIYKTSDENIVYKKSKFFNKLLSIMNICDDYSDYLSSMLYYILEIPNTIRHIKQILDKSPLIKHFNLPISYKLCICDKDNYIFDNKQYKKTLPQYEYLLPYVNGVDMNVFLSKYKYSYEDFFGIFIQLMYLTLYLNLNGIFHNDIHITNIMIKYNKDIIILRGLKIEESEININLNCNYILVIIDFESAITTNKLVIPIDFLKSLYIIKINNFDKLNNNRITNFLEIIINKSNDFYNRYYSDKYPFYNLNEFNNLPIITNDDYAFLKNIFNYCIHISNNNFIEKFKYTINNNNNSNILLYLVLILIILLF